jgi:AcrR family transcriptional regulator
MIVDVASRPPGRPRDPNVNEAILNATRALLLDVGYAGLTYEAVAARASVSKPTIYRRYPNKTALVFEAVFGQTKSRSVPDTGNLVDDLREAYGWAVEEFGSPEAIAALPGLMADLTANAELAQFVRVLVIEPEYERVRGVLESAQRRGEIRSDADLTLAIDAFTGTALARVLLLDRPVDPAFGERLVDLIVHGLAPPA